MESRNFAREGAVLNLATLIACHKHGKDVDKEHIITEAMTMAREVSDYFWDCMDKAWQDKNKPVVVEKTVEVTEEKKKTTMDDL